FNGWHDIGYNFVVDRFGRIFEARAGGIDQPIVGAHAGGFNAASTGVALLGSYTASSPSPAAYRALTRLLAWKLPLHGAPVDASGAPVAGAGIVVEARTRLSTTTLATVPTGDDGAWTAGIALQAPALLRARFTGAGLATGAVSAYHAVGIVPADTLGADVTNVVAGQAVVLSATTQPQARRITFVVEIVEPDGTG